MEISQIIRSEIRVQRVLEKMASTVNKHYAKDDQLVFVGIKKRGFIVAQRLARLLHDTYQRTVLLEQIDVQAILDQSVTFYIDISHKKIVIIDAVLHTGYVVFIVTQYILQAWSPVQLEVMILIDRGHHSVSIQPNYIGIKIPTSADEYVHVHLKPFDNQDGIFLQTKAQKAPF